MHITLRMKFKNAAIVILQFAISQQIHDFLVNNLQKLYITKTRNECNVIIHCCLYNAVHNLCTVQMLHGVASDHSDYTGG